MTEPTRCPWAENGELMRRYHDTEWGVPTRDDRKLFEFLILDMVQAGLSWKIVLERREAYRAALAGFDPQVVANFGPADIERLLANPKLIRNRLKMTAIVQDSKSFLQIQAKEGSFAKFFWSFTSDKTIQNHFVQDDEIPAQTDVSRAMSKELKRRGFAFAGPTICYAIMQSAGVVNDHLVGCFRYAELA